MIKLYASVALVACLMAGPAAQAASGTAMGVDPDAEARGAETRTLVVGADVFIGERIVTGPEGQVQILFSDRTELVVGPRSSLILEDYLLRDDGSAGNLAINALSGTFRFVTGGAAKSRYRITTPTGTIGVRGTALDFVAATAVTNVLLYHGAVRICSNSGECVDLEASCEVGQYDTGAAIAIGETDGIVGADRDALKALFAYALSQRPLLREFRVAGAEECLRRSTDTGGGGSLSDTENAPPDPKGRTRPTFPGNTIP